MSRRVLPFSPGTNYTISALATSVSTAIEANSNACRVANKGTADIFVNFTTGIVAATTANGTFIPVGGIEVFTKGANTHINIICSAAGTSTVYVTTGEGM